ncbi:MAG: YybS family protein [Peptococcaceae bacterium]|nr:YybS family protein [Peptococcaceae bacterium]
MTAFSRNQRAAEFFLLTAAALLPALAWVYVPLLSAVAAFVMPVPLAVLVRRLDLRYALGAVLAVAVLLSVVTGRPYLALLVVMETGPLGLLLGLLFKNHVPPGKSLIATAAFSQLTAAGMLLSGYLLTGANPFVLNEKQKYILDQERLLLDQVFRQAGGLDPATLRELEIMMAKLEAMWPLIAVSTALIWFMVSASVSYWLTRVTMARYGYKVHPAIPFTRWRLPWHVIWGAITGLAFMLAGDQWGMEGLAVAGKAVLWVMGFVFSVIGISVTGFYLKRWKAAWPFKLLGALILVIYLPLAVAMLVTVGITDAILNIRRLTPDGRTPEEVDNQ